MTPLKSASGLLLGLLSVFTVGAFLAPLEWEVTRSLVIAAPPEAIHARVGTLDAWEAWSPFELEDDTRRSLYLGPSAGLGNEHRWTSEDHDDGWRRVTFADPRRGVRYDIEVGDFGLFHGIVTYEPMAAGHTQVIWTEHGQVSANPFHRWKGYFVARYFGPRFEQGLENLRDLIEGELQVAEAGQ